MYNLLIFSLGYLGDPDVFTGTASLLREERAEVGRLSLAARPELHAGQITYDKVTRSICPR